MGTLEYILQKYKIRNIAGKLPIEIPDMDREELAKLFGELTFKIGAEIGVESGLYSDMLLTNNPSLHLLSIDAWRAYRGYRDHTSQQKLDRFYEETKKILAPYGSRSEIWKNSSAEALPHIRDNSLDFVYIDANHAFYNVAHDIHNWLKKVKVGGIISGHDYKKHKPGVNIHVKQVVQAYADSYFIRPWFVVGSQAKHEGWKRDDSRSWFWIKTEGEYGTL